LLVFIGGAGILLISMSRATLEIMNKDEMEGNLRVEPVIIGNKMIYKLPQTNMLPDNIFYGFREIRDWLWFKFSFGDERKVKTMLILADKRIAEARALVKKGNYNLALETGMVAVNKLKYANGLITKTLQPIAQKQLTVQVKDAALAYSEIIKEIGQQIDGDKQKYNLLQQNIDDFKKEQIQKEATEKN